MKTTQWKDWAATEDTLVFYMSGQRLKDLTVYLLEHNIDTRKGVAVIEQATTTYQKTRVFSFKDIAEIQLPEFDYVPTLLIVGNVVNLHNSYKWFNEQRSRHSYFDHHLNQLKHVI